MTATSASSASATSSTAMLAAAASFSAAEIAATNSANCWVDHDGVDISGDREDDQSLIVEAAGPAGACDLSIGVEAGNRRTGGHRRQPLDLAADAIVAQDATSGDAVEGDHPQRGMTVEGGQRVAGRGVGRLEHGAGIAFHDPDERALRNLGDAGERPLIDVAATDEAHLLLAAWAAKPQRMGQGEPRQPLLIQSVQFGGAEALEVQVERRPVVERVDAVAGA